VVAEPEEVKVAIVHGPNLNLLGQREPSVYGATTLAEIDARLRGEGSAAGVEVESYQSNVEGELIDFIQSASKRVDGFVVNAGGYTHTSVALFDALVGVGLPYVEVHISNVAARENFRHVSLLSPRAAGVVTGFGPASYSLGLRGLIDVLRAAESAATAAV
jgi:3-dehydroquinate dehydratase-2